MDENEMNDNRTVHMGAIRDNLLPRLDAEYARLKDRHPLGALESDIAGVVDRLLDRDIEVHVILRKRSDEVVDSGNEGRGHV